MEGTLKADAIYTIFEHEAIDYQDEIDKDYFFWRHSHGYVQIWLFSGVVFDILKPDEARHMWG